MRKRGSLWGKILSVFLFMLFLVFSSSARAFFLPDTGQTTCYSVKGPLKVIDCPSPGTSYAQDGSYTINPPSFTEAGFGTVVDNNTRLMWQHEGSYVAQTCSEASNYCKNLSLGGFTGWRLPTNKELVSIMDYGHYYPSLDPYIFFGPVGYYHTSTSSAQYAGTMLTVSSYDGSSGTHSCAEDNYDYVRCVRGDQLIFNDFMERGDGSVTDIATGLQWQKGEVGTKTWATALSYCENLSLGGQSDWRLPNVKELEGIIDETKHNPATNTAFFPGAYSYYYWTATSYAPSADLAYAVDFSDGRSLYNYKTGSNHVRCVRGSRTSSFDAWDISVSPSALGFGIVPVDNSSSLALTVSNVGMGNLAIGTISVPSSPFSIILDGCSGHTLSWGESCVITASFDPVEEGIFIDSISIPSNDADNSVKALKLSGSTGSFLPDTGQTKCYDSSGNLISCPPPGDYLAQDGSYNINPPSYSAIGDGTILDDNTGLMWQQYAGTYNWYEASGTYDKKYNRKTVNVCGSLVLGGHTDWRLPTKKELMGIADFWTAATPFSGGQCEWTSTPAVGSATAASCGAFGTLLKTSSASVRCVRGEGFTYGNFKGNGDGTVTDTATGLMWQQTYISVDEGKQLACCEGLTYAGHSDWRAPNIRELMTLIDETRLSPPMNTTFFPFDSSYYDHAYFWSSTASYSTEKWYIDFTGGLVGSTIDFSTRLGCSMGLARCGSFVRCVRGGANTPEMPAELTGTVSDSSTGQRLPYVTIAVTDEIKKQSTMTDSEGIYRISDITPGSITSVFQKEGFVTNSVNGFIAAGQTLTLNVQLSPISPISISISSPQNGAVLSTSSVTVTGSISNGASVSVNGFQATISGSAFSASIPLGEGQDTITAMATDQYGQTVSQSITVTVVLPKPPSITGINASDITADSATITWTTDQPSDSRVEYGKTTSYGNVAEDLSLATAHSVKLANLNTNTTYHFMVSSKNTGGLASVSGDYTFTTSKFQASFLGDFGDVAVMEVKGSYDSINPDGTMNYLPRQEIAKEFIKSHADDYDFMIIFSNFDFALPQAEAKAFYLEVRNDIQGIGKTVFDDSASYGSNGRLQGIIDMGDISGKASNPADTSFEDTLATLAHEQMHRWGAEVRFKDSSGNISNALLGKDGEHWSYLLDTDGSVVYGDDWQDNKDGTFTSTGKERYYSSLDLYLMGFYDKSQVPPMLLIDNPSINPARLPEVGTTITGTARYVSIDDIITTEGARIPDASTSQKNFKTAFILITTPNTFTGKELPGIENIRSAWAGRFAKLTAGKGSIMDIAPNITIVVSSPISGDTITGPNVAVKGAVINNTGNETGVTINGVLATVYGDHFVANHVPLVEGANTLTITATDTSGNTSSTSIPVNAATGDYMKLASNIESGIAPLEVVLRIDGSVSIDNSNMSVTGPAAIELIDNTSPDEYTIKMTAEGIYYFTASVSGPDGKTYQDTLAITVMNKTQLDTLLKAKWEGMKEAMKEKDIEKAMPLFLSSSQERYRYIYTNLLDIIPTIATNMRPIEMVTMEGGVTEYRIRKQETVGEVTYYIYFVLDENGTWKIQQF